MVKLLASHHARERARQRIGWHRRTLDRMLERVFYDGLGPEDCSRRLGEFVAATVNTAAGLSRIYGEHLFLFTRDHADEVVLLTVYPLPSELKSAAHRARRQQNALAA